MSDPIGSVRLAERGGFVVASLTGEIDLSNATDVQTAIEEAVANTHRGVVVDLTDAGYLDSSAITVLFRLLRQTRARNQQFRVVLPKESPLRRVIYLTELPELVEVYENPGQAVKADAGEALSP